MSEILILDWLKSKPTLCCETVWLFTAWS